MLGGCETARVEISATDYHTAGLTEVQGTAFRTGEHRFLLDARDPLGTGFVLR